MLNMLPLAKKWVLRVLEEFQSFSCFFRIVAIQMPFPVKSACQELSALQVLTTVLVSTASGDGSCVRSPCLRQLAWTSY